VLVLDRGADLGLGRHGGQLIVPGRGKPNEAVPHRPHQVRDLPDGQGLSEGYRELFRVTREQFLEDTATIGISHRVTRLRTLQRLADRAEAQGNIALAAQLVVQAAKEVGDVFTNRQRIDANHTVRSHEDALGDLE
jgi:hypothetical protein